MKRTFEFSVVVEDTIRLECSEDAAKKLDEVLDREGKEGPGLMLDDLPGEIHIDLIDRLNGEMQIVDVVEVGEGNQDDTSEA